MKSSWSQAGTEAPYGDCCVVHVENGASYFCGNFRKPAIGKWVQHSFGGAKPAEYHRIVEVIPGERQHYSISIFTANSLVDSTFVPPHTQTENKMDRASTTIKARRTPADDEYQICGIQSGDFFVHSTWQVKVGDVVKWYNPDTRKYETGTISWVSTGTMNLSAFPIVALTDLITRAAGASAATTTIQPTKENAPMSCNPVKVETQLLINGTPAKSFTDDDVLAYVQSSQAEVKRLTDMNVTSTKVAARIDALQKGITDLLVLLDART